MNLGAESPEVVRGAQKSKLGNGVVIEALAYVELMWLEHLLGRGLGYLYGWALEQKGFETATHFAEPV